MFRYSAAPADRVSAIALLKRLADLLGAGIGLGDALRVCSRAGGGGAALARSLSAAVARGVPMAKALSRRCPALSAAELAVIEAGQASGTLNEAIELLSLWLGEQNSRRGALTAALAYPLFVVLCSLGALGFLAVAVIPGLSDLYVSQGRPLPPLSAYMLTLRELLVTHGLQMLLGLGGSATMVAVIFRRSRPIRDRVDRALCGAPVLGEYVLASAKARLAKLVCMLVSSGCEVELTLELGTSCTANHWVAARIDRIRASVTRGVTLSRAWRLSGLDSDGADAVLLELAEAGGDYAKAFSRISSAQSLKAEFILKRSVAIIQPLALTFAALLVGVGAAAVYEPILGSRAFLNATLP